MKRTDRRLLVAALAITAGALLVVGLAWPGSNDGPKSWKPIAEGYLAVATPCCTEAALWDELGSITDEGQRLRPASAAEAAAWLDAWPSGDLETGIATEIAAQSTEVRCVGEPTGPEVTYNGNDVGTLEAIRQRPECLYAKWKVWTAETAEERPNERHKVWAGEDGLFRGRVEYWK